MHLYNTLTRKKELLKPITPEKILLYHCGPTVYWTQHIGNMRAMTMGDLVVRTLRYVGYDVVHVRNYTDVGHLTSDADTGEDKMEKGVKREGMTPKEIADKYIAQFEADTRALNLVSPTKSPRATDYIAEMIAMISDLMTKGYAYTTDLAVYFDVTKFPTYTKLSNQKIELLEEGAGKATVADQNKKHANDFALWFFKAGVHKNAIQTWPSAFTSTLVFDGLGFPGWHIECSAMCRKLLGKTIDIHMGGIEHISVHHTNEIAQSECANGVKFVNYWLHNAHLLVDGKKMAKSEGTGYALSELTKKGFDPLALRYFFLQAQYRSNQNFTWEGLKASSAALTSLRELTASWTSEKKQNEIVTSRAKEFRDAFRLAIEDDFNIPKAVSVVWDMAKSDISNDEKYSLILNFDTVLGLGVSDITKKNGAKEQIPQEIEVLRLKRESLRKEKKFEDADLVRKQIEDLGYIVKDSSSDSIVVKI